MIDAHEYFYSLVKPKVTPKKKRCLKCRQEFVMIHNRICSQCTINQQHVGVRGGYYYPTPRSVIRQEVTA